MITTIALILTLLVTILVITDMCAIPLFLVFLVLKLCGIVAWSWLWVCFPLIVLGGTLVLIIFSEMILCIIGD